MKKLLSSLVALIIAFGAGAQELDMSRLGVRMTIDAACPGDLSVGDGYTSMSIFGNGAGLSLGAVYQFGLSDKIYLEPGLSLYYNSMSINKDFLADALEQGIGNIDYEFTSRSVRKFGMRIPVMVGVTLPLDNDFALRVFTGPMLDVGFSADLYYGMKVDGYDVHKASSLYGSKRMLNRVDCYWNIGVGVNFSEHYTVSLQCDLGMANMAKKQGNLKPSMHETLVQVGFGYNF